MFPHQDVKPPTTKPMYSRAVTMHVMMTVRRAGLKKVLAAEVVGAQGVAETEGVGEDDRYDEERV